MQIFYLNLDAETGRRAYMEAQFAETGLVAERIAAITPADLAPDLIRQACDRTKRHWVGRPELACTMTHRLAWRAILERGLPMALILEDDVYLSRRLSELISAVELLCAGLDVIRIETYQPRVRLGRADRRGDLDLREIHSVVWGCGGYIVTNAGARRLLGPLSRIDVPVDAVIFNYHLSTARRLQTRQVVPAGVANGEVARHLRGTELFASTIGDIRRPRAKGDPVGIRGAAAVTIRQWGGALAARRDQIRAWFDRKLRGIEVMDIPLF
jgi:glycosyl transferase family 25